MKLWLWRWMARFGRAIPIFACVGLLWACASDGPSGPRAIESAPAGRGTEQQPASFARAPERVVLVSVGGLTPDAYGAFRFDRSLATKPKQAAMPELAARAERGVQAEAVNPVTPAAAYPAHATLVTGRRPDRHGVVSDHLLGPRGVRNALYWHASRVDGGSLWQSALDARRGVVALNWPSTTGASIDLVLPDILPIRAEETWLRVLGGATTPWLLDRAVAVAPATLASEEPSADARDQLVVSLACEIARQDAVPDLWLLRLEHAGAVLERHGPGSSQARAALALTDERIARIERCVSGSGRGATTAFIVTGDRAVLPVHTRIDPNVVLLHEGLIGVVPGAPDAVERWKAIVRSNGRTAFVYAATDEDALAARDVLRDAADKSGAYRVLSAARLQALRADPNAWFGLEAMPGFVFGNGVRSPLLRPSMQLGGSGYAADEGNGGLGLVAWGAGLRAGVRVPSMEQIDVAPTIATLLGLRLGDTEGRPLIGAMTLGTSPAVGAR